MTMENAVFVTNEDHFDQPFDPLTLADLEVRSLNIGREIEHDLLCKRPFGANPLLKTGLLRQLRFGLQIANVNASERIDNVRIHSGKAKLGTHRIAENVD